MKNNRIRLNENTLRKIIKESVRRVLSEVEVVGKIDNFDPNKSYGQFNGNFVDNQQILKVARQKLLKAISNPFEIYGYWSAKNGNYFGNFAIDEGDWYFESEDVPVFIEIDKMSSYEPATYDHPEEWGDCEAHAEILDAPKGFWCVIPGSGKQDIWLPTDKEIANLFMQNAKANYDIDGEILDEREADIIASQPDEYDYFDYYENRL